MQIVINISDTLKEIIDSDDIKTASHPMWVAIMMDAIKNGTPLPKGHGRLIDESDLMPDSDYEDGIFYAVSIGMIGNAPTIIEADTEGSESE